VVDLSSDFIDRWKDEEEQPSLAAKIRGFVKPSSGLKKRLNLANRHIELQIQGLNRALEGFAKRDAAIFKRIVKLYSTRDKLRANVLANELAELRKVEKMLMHSKLALEGVALRLKTVSELGDVVTILAPASGVIKNIQSEMGSVFPAATKELENIGTLLTEIVSSTNQTTGMSVNVETANEEAEKILKEAASAAEQRIKEKFPDITAAISLKEKAKLKT
jgi:division protein CdvB (Snf7/Vps24/ESCRT-III family)